MRLVRAVKLYLASPYTWRTCRKLAASAPAPRYQVVPRDGFLYIEPR